jgi:hypothetical protein
MAGHLQASRAERAPVPQDLSRTHAERADLEQTELVCELEPAIAGYDADIEELGLISSTTRSDGARVSAVKARIRARDRKRSAA